MSIADKQVLMHDIEKSLGSSMTADDIARTMQVLSECLSMYEVQRLHEDGTDAETSELLETFLNAKRVEGRSEKTIERYEYIINRALKAVNAPIRKISVFHLRKYFSDEKTRGISDSTLDGIRQTLSSFFGWLHKEGLIVNNPTANLGAIKSAKKVRKPYSSVDLEKLKEACDCDRDKAIISLLFSTGCRISEVCQLDRDSVDFDNMEILVLGKGNKERTVFIDDITAMLLKRYMDSRNDKLDPLFIGKGKERLLPGGIRQMLNRLEERSGVPNVHPHRFRRTLATNLIDHGMPIQEVAAILGHEKLDTTMKYVYLNKANVKSSYRKHLN